MKPDIKILSTYGHEPSRDIPWNEYPRPQMRRSSFICLNGKWDLLAGEGSSALYSGEVTVPYPVESALSGIQRHFPDGTPLNYSRNLPSIPHKEDERVILHVDAVDQEADIFINDKKISHIITFEGRAGVDITEYLTGSDIIQIRVTDDLTRREFPYGKQTLKRGGMWYTPFSGIWQSVWIEIVPKEYIRSLKILPSLSAATIEIDGPSCGTAFFEGKEIPFDDGKVILAPKEPHLWSPDDPYLYEFSIRCGEDEVQSYFALRTLDIRTVNGSSRLCLNGKPFFFHGLLDQGYWPDGLCTPPDPSCFAEDILAMKDLGFNTLRKHIKLESDLFYYECDRLGMIVFQDMINNGKYSFFRDTVLPTIGIKKLDDSRLNRDENTRRMFFRSMGMTVQSLYSHPSVCCWTIFNEGWGQFCSSSAYDRLKELDDSRFIDTASGWFIPVKSDVTSQHVYFWKFKMPRTDKPVLLSEFGGYSLKVPEHSFNLSKTYGYRFYKDPDRFCDALIKLYEDEIIPAAMSGLSGAIYTQVSDVEDETNGLLTYDRAVCKACRDDMLSVADKLYQIQKDLSDYS